MIDVARELRFERDRLEELWRRINAAAGCGGITSQSIAREVQAARDTMEGLRRRASLLPPERFRWEVLQARYVLDDLYRRMVMLGGCAGNPGGGSPPGGGDDPPDPGDVDPPDPNVGTACSRCNATIGTPAKVTLTFSGVTTCTSCVSGNNGYIKLLTGTLNGLTLELDQDASNPCLWEKTFASSTGHGISMGGFGLDATCSGSPPLSSSTLVARVQKSSLYDVLIIVFLTNPGTGFTPLLYYKQQASGFGLSDCRTARTLASELTTCGVQSVGGANNDVLMTGGSCTFSGLL